MKEQKKYVKKMKNKIILENERKLKEKIDLKNIYKFLYLKETHKESNNNEPKVEK